MLDAVRQFAGAKYLSLETFRRTGIDVRTPVWFAQDILHSAPSTLNDEENAQGNLLECL
jgi:hypothetical protein